MAYKYFFLFIFLGLLNLFGQDVNENLVVHYKFDGNFNDATPNNYHATNQGATFADDRNGNPNSAVYFNGTNDYIDLPNENDLKPQMPFTISFWIKYSSSNFNDQEVFELSYEHNRNSGVYFNSEIHTGKMAINIANGAYNYISTARRSYVSENIIQLDTWTNVVAVVSDFDDMEIYYDCKGMGGNYSGSATSLVYSGTNGVLGKRQRNLNSSPNFFQGYLDDFKIWDRALSLNEVSSICTYMSNDSFEGNQLNVTIYPNPSDGIINIQSTFNFENLEVINQIGQNVFKSDYQNSIDLSHLSSGMYFIRLSGQDTSKIQKIILE